MKLKRLMAVIGVILILSMYVVAIVSAFSKSPNANSWLMAAIFSTVVVPIVIYAVQLVYRILKPEDREEPYN